MYRRGTLTRRHCRRSNSRSCSRSRYRTRRPLRRPAVRSRNGRPQTPGILLMSNKTDTDRALMDLVEHESSEAYRDMDLLRFSTAGSVDDGKSTLIGRLLYDTKSIFQDQLEAIEGASR